MNGDAKVDSKDVKEAADRAKKASSRSLESTQSKCAPAKCVVM